MQLTAVLAAALVIVTPTTPTTTAQPHPAVALKPSSGKAGSGFTIAWSGFPTCRVLTFAWEGAPLTSTTAPPASGQVNATVPADAKPGGHVVTGTCTSQKLTARAIFTVIGTPTTTSAPPPKTTIPPTTPPPPVTSRRPPLPEPSTPVTDVPPPPSTVDTPPPPTTTTPPTSPPPPTSPSDGNLLLDRPTIRPGDPLSATGQGCTPNSPVTLTSKGTRVGAAIADINGAFVTPVEFTRIEPGRHTITATCGVVLTGAVDQVVTSSTGGHGSTLVILVFFVLAGVLLIRFP